MDHKELLHAQSLHAIMKWFTTMLSKETVSGFSYVRQVHRNLEGLSPSNSAQNRPPVSKVLGLEHFFTLLQVLRLPERTGNSAQLRIRTVCWCHYIYIYIYIQKNLVIGVSLLDFMRLFTWFNPLGDSEADRDDFSYSLKSLFKTVFIRQETEIQMV